MSVIKELKRQLQELKKSSPEDFEALKRKIGGKIGLGVGAAAVGFAEGMGAEQRRLLPAQLSVITGRSASEFGIKEPVAGGTAADELALFQEKERIKRRVGEEFPKEETGFQREKFEFEKEKEARMLSQEERRNLQIKIDNVDSFGATIGPKEFDEVLTTTGQDISDWQERWGLKKDKEENIRLPSKKERDVIVGRETIPPAELEHLNDYVESADIMREVLVEIKKQGIEDPETFRQIGKAIPRGYFKGIGPLSPKARFDLIANLQDPRFAALKDKLDRAFQKYRKIITGAQASDKELKTIRPLVANFLQAPERFFINANDIVSEADRAFNRRLDLMESVGRDVSGLRGLIEAGPGGTTRTETTSSAGVNVQQVGRFTVETQ